MEIKVCKNIDLIYDRYLVDFPADERKSREKTVEMIREGRYDLFLAEEESIEAYMLAYKSPGKSILFMDFFAVFSEFRGKGVGTRFLTELMRMYKYIVFEVELSDADPCSVTTKREMFYRRLGAVRIDVPYELPTPNGSLPMNLFVLGFDEELNISFLRDFVCDAVLYIHSDIPHSEEIVSKYKNFFDLL